MLAESEEKLAELQMQMLDPALASDYPKLMELQSAVDAEEANQDSLLERMLETETELAGVRGSIGDECSVSEYKDSREKRVTLLFPSALIPAAP